jgi:succinyl-CoA synthetase beta subunit
MQELTDAFIVVFQDPKLVQVLVNVLGGLFQDPEIVNCAGELFMKVLQSKDVKNVSSI